MKRKLSNGSRFRHPTLERAQEVDNVVPFASLQAKLNKSKSSNSGSAVHWFRTKDLRAEDNVGLTAAAKRAEKHGSSLFTIFVFNREELRSHGVGNNRNAFMLQGLKALKEQLKKQGIPLAVKSCKSTKETVDIIADFMKETGSLTLFANFEYEYDEIMRDIQVVDRFQENDMDFQLLHDQTILEPGSLTTSTHSPRKVFTPFWNDWVPAVNKLDLSLLPVPKQPGTSVDEKFFNSKDEADIFDTKLDTSLEKLWPAGHDSGIEKLNHFIDKKIDRYGNERSTPAKDCVSRLSPYFALGFISAREALVAIKERKNVKSFGTSTNGVDSWVRELAFREFYRQIVAVVCPHIVMNVPMSLKLNNVEFVDVESEEGKDSWDRWVSGTTGYPFVDAGMRQLNSEGYMHNRLRMNVASYLKMTMLLDYRLGANYFANHLLDWDCCNNMFGWDPSLTVFNPVLQAEKCDPAGNYIRKWIPELRNVFGKAIFDPYHRMQPKEFEKLGYPAPQERQKDLQDCKKRALERYKRAYGKIKQEEQ